MDRFYWFNGPLDHGNEREITSQNSVRLYDGDDKTTFDSGNLFLTNLKLIWTDDTQKDRKIALDLSLVSKISSEGSSMFKSAKLSLHLHPCPKDKQPGPKRSSSHKYIRLSFRVGGHEQFASFLKQALSEKAWELILAATGKPKKEKSPEISHRHVGIGGIERKRQEKYERTDETITQAFKDLDALIEKAKDMVVLAEKFSTKLKDKQISITDDETVQFKSYLLSMGIDNPVTRETHGSGVRYHEELAKQLASFLSNIIEDEGGVMTLTDVYCRFNRARGIELISPDDVLNAAKLLETLKLSMRLRRFDSGVLVVQSLAHTEEEMMSMTTQKVEELGSLTPDEYSHVMRMALTLARERLLLSEKGGLLCRDDSLEGLRFYPNKFATMTT